MKEIHSDINIIGGGLIGAITAYSLSKIGLKITILEKKPYYNKNTHTDHRTVAISEGTKKFLETVLLWSKIKTYCEPIKKIKVIDREFTSQLEFDNLRRDSNLGYIVKNKHLLEAVYLELRNNKNIKIFNSKRYKTKNTHGTGCTLSSAVTTFISCGKPVKKSCELGIKYVNSAIKTNPNYGKGHGPINHLTSIKINRKFN